MPSKSIPKSNGTEVVTDINAYLQKNGYQMGKILGEGSYSKVRVCNSHPVDGSTSRKIACKIINKRKASGDFVTKFLPRELQIVRKLDHPNIIHVYDLVEFDDRVYIFMDCCDRGDLLEYIKIEGFIDEHKGRLYFRQLLSAVRYLHSQDLAHRDLKCENVLLASPDQIRISDFGFARYCTDKTGRRTLSNTYCGSAAYAAPEILMGTHYNPKLYDMWSLGCVLFIMLTGHMPFDESNLSRMLDNQMKRILVYPIQNEGKITHSAKSIIRHLLEPDVTRRANIDQALSHLWLRECVTSMQQPRPSSSRASTETVKCHPSGKKNSGCGDGNFEARKSSPLQGPIVPAHTTLNGENNGANAKTRGDAFEIRVSRIPVLNKFSNKNIPIKCTLKPSTPSADNRRSNRQEAAVDSISSQCQFGGMTPRNEKKHHPTSIQSSSGRPPGVCRIINTRGTPSGNATSGNVSSQKKQWR